MTSAKAAKLTEQFVQEIRDIAHNPIPDDVRNVAILCIIDSFGVAIAGAQQPVVDMLIDETDASSSRGKCTIIGRRQLTTTPGVAALVNGFSADVLDFSDHNLAIHGHPTACVLPAALAMAEVNGISGEELIRSYVVGVEAACRLGNIVDIAIMSTAFHPTAMFGSFGAASAVAQQLDLDSNAWQRALAILATQAAGLKAAAGTQCKPFHAGKAASNGLLAARLAKRGFNAPAAILEHRVGFLAGHVRDIDALPLTDALSQARGRFLILNNTVKEYAACRLTHGTINNMQQLRSAHALTPSQVVEIKLEVPPSYLNICNIPAPTTSLEAKFSLRTMAALSLLGHDMGQPATYDNATFEDREAIALRDRISVVARPGSDFEVSVATIKMADGQTITSTSDDRDTTGDLVARGDGVRRKFRSLVAPILGADACSELLQGIDTLHKQDSIRSVLRPLNGPIAAYTGSAPTSAKAGGATRRAGT